nr:hypothetical protein [uncultured Aminipila sp.]
MDAPWVTPEEYTTFTSFIEFANAISIKKEATQIAKKGKVLCKMNLSFLILSLASNMCRYNLRFLTIKTSLLF